MCVIRKRLKINFKDDGEEMDKQTYADYDSPWKEAIEHLFVDFMGFFFDSISQQIDWSQPYEFLDKELEKITRDAEIGRRYADKLVKVCLKNGQSVWVLIHIEVQSQHDPDFEKRMYIYNFRILERYKKDVASLAILTYKPNNHLSHQDSGEYRHQFWGCETRFIFPLIKLWDYRKNWLQLEQSDNLFAIVVMAHLKAVENKDNPQQLKESKLGLIKGLYERGLTREQILELLCFIDWLMVLPRELENTLTLELEKLEEDNQMNYVTSFERRGLEQGIEKEKILLLRQIRRRFDEQTSFVAQAKMNNITDTDVLETIGDLIIDCNDAAQFLTRLDALSV